MQNMPFRKNWVQYIGYLVQDIGDPPDIESGPAPWRTAVNHHRF